jgi:hypothetical protein
MLNWGSKLPQIQRLPSPQTPNRTAYIELYFFRN